MSSEVKKTGANVRQYLKEIIVQSLTLKEQQKLFMELKNVKEDVKNIFFLVYSSMNSFHRSINHRKSNFNVHGILVNVSHWSIVEILRVYCILHLPIKDTYHLILDKLLLCADFKERIAYYKGLSLYPDIAGHYRRAREGLRCSIQSVFESIAINNSYVSQYLEEESWNQMILKALFLGVNINLIHSLDMRANVTLKIMLLHYAEERVAAGRRIDPRLWRCVGPFLLVEDLIFLKESLDRNDPQEQLGIALALNSSTLTEANELLNKYSNLQQKIQKYSLSWESLQWESLYYDKKK